jgi:hypothetical protein
MALYELNLKKGYCCEYGVEGPFASENGVLRGEEESPMVSGSGETESLEDLPFFFLQNRLGVVAVLI